jgi:hypothetical protein
MNNLPANSVTGVIVLHYLLLAAWQTMPGVVADYSAVTSWKKETILFSINALF